jgi:hypothetical protein
MNDCGKSDRSVVPKKQPSKSDAKAPPAEAVEGRDLTKGKSLQQNTRQVLRRTSKKKMHAKLRSIRAELRRRMPIRHVGRRLALSDHKLLTRAAQFVC